MYLCDRLIFTSRFADRLAVNYSQDVWRLRPLLQTLSRHHAIPITAPIMLIIKEGVQTRLRFVWQLQVEFIYRYPIRFEYLPLFWVLRGS